MTDWYGPWRAFNEQDYMVVIFAYESTIEKVATGLGYTRWEKDE